MAETLHDSDLFEGVFGGSQPKSFLHEQPFRIDDPKVVFIKPVIEPFSPAKPSGTEEVEVEEEGAISVF